MKRIAIPALTTLLTVAGMVAAAGWNRSSDPQQVITLTERELVLPEWVSTPSAEDPGVHLVMGYQPRNEPLDSRNWLPQERLREIGFTFNVAPTSPQAADAYDRVPPRIAWVAFEHAGPAWREIDRRQGILFPERSGMGALSSHLVPVDAGPDRDALLRRYPTNHLIVRGMIGVRYLSPEAGGPLVYGTLRDIVPRTIPVPASLRGVFDGLTPVADHPERKPRYEAEIVVGRLGLPYVRSARRLE